MTDEVGGAMTEPIWAVEARAIVKRYGDATALDGVDLDVAPGELVAITGPSGCGKSTLLHLLGGLDRPTAGEVRVAGERIDHLGESARAVLRRTEIGFVFQAYNLVPNITVGANVELPGRLAGRPRAELAARRAELLGMLGIEDLAGRAPSSLSGGQQQRVAIARALVNRPAVLLADEPTGNLDTKAGAAVLSLLQTVHESGQAIVLVTHDHKVAAAAQRVVRMRDGRVEDEAILPTRRRRSQVSPDEVQRLLGTSP